MIFDGSSNGSGAQSVSAANNAGVSSTPATTFTVTPDSSAPTGGLLSINPYSGSLTVSIAKTDFTDAISGIATNVVTRSNPQAPSSPGTCPLGSYAGATVVGASDTVPSDGQCYQYTLTGTDNVGNTATFQTIVLVDTTGPTGGSLAYVDGLATLGSVSIDWVSGSDPESGIASVQIERAAATLTGPTCGGFGAFTPLGGPVGSSPTVDTSVTAGNCYAYRLVVTNNTGLASTFTSPSVAKITNASPITTSRGQPGRRLSRRHDRVGRPGSREPPLEARAHESRPERRHDRDVGRQVRRHVHEHPRRRARSPRARRSGPVSTRGTAPGRSPTRSTSVRNPGGTDDFVDVRLRHDQPVRVGQLPECDDPDPLRACLEHRDGCRVGRLQCGASSAPRRL